MKWLFESGLSAARIQASFVLLLVVVLPSLTPDSSQEARLADATVLRWVFLAGAAITATGVTHSVSRTAARLAWTTQALTGGRGKRLQVELFARLGIATAALAVLTIAPAPGQVTELFEPLLGATATLWVWGGGMSVGVAYFGAAALAARRALRG